MERVVGREVSCEAIREIGHLVCRGCAAKWFVRWVAYFARWAAGWFAG